MSSSTISLNTSFIYYRKTGLYDVLVLSIFQMTFLFITFSFHDDIDFNAFCVLKKNSL